MPDFADLKWHLKAAADEVRKLQKENFRVLIEWTGQDFEVMLYQDFNFRTGK